MPIAKIEVCRPRTAVEVAALIDAVYQAQLIALKVPEDDKQIRYIEYKPEHFPVPPSKTENYTLVEIQIFPGRSLDAKRNLYNEVARRFGEIGIQPNDITIILHEPSLDNWGVGGKSASEINLGFKLDV
ncbi:tautomerase family protein [Roseateles oligotrophus]|uniref:Tautomerase family protein n=1 Tax=Roseateles oligotrophus TaxID=1769250 RepID=A0ABT2YH61_9BURK|nr:tautomerase family protein [Roseateles oligotrophus]MCV2369390.1 tautomerase family protein [Roseateles oligotrophus]